MRPFVELFYPPKPSAWKHALVKDVDEGDPDYWGVEQKSVALAEGFGFFEVVDNRSFLNISFLDCEEVVRRVRLSRHMVAMR